jgi:carbon monoxide dehydrogenase subunit G
VRIENRFKVSLPVDDAWKVLLDIERIAPCMPGAELQEVDGEEYRGVVKVKLGAITTQFKGVVRFTEVDESARRIVMRAEGRDTRGQGNANATVTAVLTPAGEGTDVAIDTDLSISGKVAQFGRGVMGEVSNKLLGQFVSCLEADLAGPSVADEEVVVESSPGAPAPVADAEQPAAVGGPPRRIASRPAEPVDLFAVASGSMAQRALPLGGVAIMVALALVKRAPLRWILAAAGAGVIAALSRSQSKQGGSG